MPTIEVFLLLVAVGIFGGSIAGLGGPGGIPVILALNLLLPLPSPVSAATSSGIFIVATLVTTGLYQYSDGIDWVLAAIVGVPAVAGTYVGTRIAAVISEAGFEFVLAAVFVITAIGITYQASTGAQAAEHDPGTRPATGMLVLIAALCLFVGVTAGITGIGGPALIVPLLLVFGLPPITAIGAGVASGILITTNSVMGHFLQGNTPAPVPVLVIGVPYVLSQLLGWRYVHVVSDETVSYTIAGLAIAGAVVIVL
jgi:uncharacterized membrane protein YfcA